jgi:hypothetical protein
MRDGAVEVRGVLQANWQYRITTGRRCIVQAPNFGAEFHYKATGYRIHKNAKMHLSGVASFSNF